MLGHFMARNGVVIVSHTNLEAGSVFFFFFLRCDGVHLNAVGIDLWNLELQYSIEAAVRVWPRSPQSWWWLCGREGPKVEAGLLWLWACGSTENKIGASESGLISWR